MTAKDVQLLELYNNNIAYVYNNYQMLQIKYVLYNTEVIGKGVKVNLELTFYLYK